MADLNKISDGELFADLQMSLADIALLEMLKDVTLAERLDKERNIAKVIKTEIRYRFTDTQIMQFLVNGYSRQVNLSKIIK